NLLAGRNKTRAFVCVIDRRQLRSGRTARVSNGGLRMANHYRELAAQCIRRAKETEAPEQKALFLIMAELWIKLAARHEEVNALLTPAIAQRIDREQTC